MNGHRFDYGCGHDDPRGRLRAAARAMRAGRGYGRHGRHHDFDGERTHDDDGEWVGYGHAEDGDSHMTGRHGGWGRGFGPGFGGPGFGGQGGRGRGARGRPLQQGDLRWLALDLIAAEPRHGYDIIKAIEDALHGHYAPSAGAVYPMLTLLEETGLIAAEEHGAKKLYRLTDDGRAEIEANAAEIKAARARLEAASVRFGGSPAPELSRAMHNLHAAIQVRLSKGALSGEALARVTAALDRAASEIEQS